ncbi:MAG: GNAT family N-acetyltransferase [Defluviitaleaceae bacterium]|nr:GNAT family N-acetyltransferase [Defluviitaleaceae bacterium]
MELVLREMIAGEAKVVQSLGIKSFLRSLEGFYVSKPVTARVAVKGDEIVGGFLYAIENCGEKKLGFVDFFFVDPVYAGQGIGRALCEEGASYLWAEGCDYLATFVRDDNVGSWAAFEKAGFLRADLPKVAGALGLAGFVKAYVKHLYGVCIGCDLYFAVCPENQANLPAYSKKSGIGQMVLHVLANITFLMILILSTMGISNVISDPALIISVLPSLLIIFGGTITLGYIGTLFSKRKWHYRMVSGGLLLSLIFSVFGMFIPVAGNWYPDRYENTSKFRADMFISAILPWIYLIGLFVIIRLAGDEIGFLSSGLWTVGALLMFRCIPFSVVNLGSVRVFRWNKVLWAVMVLASIFIVYFW